MAKWIYEKWSLKWDKDLLLSKENFINVVNGYNFIDLYGDDTKLISRGLRYNEAPIYSVLLNTTLNEWLFKTEETRPKKIATGGTTLYKSILSTYAIRDKFVEVITEEEGTYPDDGIHTDGYWYVKIKKAFPAMRILRDGEWVEVETGYVLKDGVWKQIEEIYKLQDGQWVQA